MTNNPPSGPTGPTIEPSEPEQKQRVVDGVFESVTSDDARIVIGLNNVNDSIKNSRLTVDEHGFIVNEETGEYATAYAYDRDTFKEVPSPVDDPFSAYFVPEQQVTECILSKDRIHLTDVHSFVYIDDELHPVRDDQMPIDSFHHEVGLAFNIVMAWSDSRDLLDDEEVKPRVHFDHPTFGEEPVEITCLYCEYTNPVEEWDGDNDDPVCPDCGHNWNTTGYATCPECDTTTQWEDLDHGSYYGKTYCPECGAENGFENLVSHYHKHEK